VNTASLLAFNLGGHGAACGLFLLLACLSWRDGDASLAWRLTAALAFCVAANAMVTAPGFFPARYWQAPILALSWGAPALFWLWARAAQGPEGPIRIRFTEHNPFGIMDHYVDVGAGGEIYAPMRIVANGVGAEALFTLFRQPDMTDAKFEADGKWVLRDLRALRDLFA
jgi:hypothetical protein